VSIDLAHLRRHYASLSDEALLEIDSSELVEAARACYDEELASRGLAAGRPLSRAGRTPADRASRAPAPDPETDGDGTPAWLDDAACACSFVPVPGDDAARDAAAASEALEAAGLPCHLDVHESPAEDPERPAQQEYRVMVPGALNLQATSILDRDVFNPRLEEEWRAHFAELSDEELSGLDPEEFCAGLVDRVERLRRAYGDEIAKRRLA
jgi:hypothetical protein